MAQRLCKICQGWHDLDQQWPHNCRSEAPPRSALPAPRVIGDTMQPVQSMLDGRFYDSKSALRATYKPSGNAEGKRYNEVGNDSSVTNPKPYRKPAPDRQAIKATVGKAFSRAGLGA